MDSAHGLTSKNDDHEIRTEIANYLGRYVYALVDPRDGNPFYIGKGTGQRVLQHGWDAARWADAESQASKNLTAEEHAQQVAVEQAKFTRIEEIKKSGNTVDVWILRHHLSKVEYGVVEATVIDLLMTYPIAPLTGSGRRQPLLSGTKLTNKVRGEHVEFGIARLADIVRDFSAPDLTTDVPLLLITLGSWRDQIEVIPGGEQRAGFGFKSQWFDRVQLDQEIDELGKSVCCWWRLNVHRVEQSGIRHIVAVYGGVTRGLFEIFPDSAETVAAVTERGEPTTRSGYQVVPVTAGALYDAAVGPNGHRIPAKKKGERGQFRYWPYQGPSD
ncbi:MAG: hypothetical protein WBG47_05775 [Gordonia sp. (in: high G+C Gram-positive bacteria)]|uniref:LEM-3-like GIY-YIG domain-containing protein n=1 Tax=Gordonia sp. (in: high G+C Gram-positive bacteria) TaxID=84139 RepID=UPI003C75D857